MNYSQELIEVSEALQKLFKDGGSLRGIEDWNVLITCVKIINRVAEELEDKAGNSEDDGAESE